MMKNLVGRLVKEEEGQGLVEYGLILAVIVGIGALIVGTGDSGLKSVITEIFTNLVTEIKKIN